MFNSKPRVVVFSVGLLCGVILLSVLQKTAAAGPTQALKDWFEILSKSATLAIAFYGVWKGIESARRAIEEKRSERRQKQLSAAREMIKELFSDPPARAAMLMLDWSGRFFKHEGTEIQVHWRDLKPALIVHTPTTAFTPEQRFIRDSFEVFFDHLQVIEHFIQQQYLNEDDIAVPLAYYAQRITLWPDTYNGFLDAYGYQAAKQLLTRLSGRVS